MILPVGELLSRIKLFSGIGIMENGDISILLDVDNLPYSKCHKYVPFGYGCVCDPQK